MAPHKRTPVIMLSTSGMNDDVEKCYALGANSYVTKPLKFNEFTQKIRELNLYWVLTSEIPGPNMPTSEHRY
ncbi:MAG: response regulator [Gammaproteobacteria bacterium]